MERVFKRPADGGGQIRWNFFQHRSEPGIWCAVPVDYAVPSFLCSDQWRFNSGDRVLRGFEPTLRPRVAMHGARLNGFFVFHRLSSATPGRSTRRS